MKIESYSRGDGQTRRIVYHDDDSLEYPDGAPAGMTVFSTVAEIKAALEADGYALDDPAAGA